MIKSSYETQLLNINTLKNLQKIKKTENIRLDKNTHFKIKIID